MEKKTRKAKNDFFVLFTIVISALLALLYTWKSYKEGFLLIGCIIITLNILYIPFALIFKKNGFHWFYLLYSAILLWAAAFEDTYLYNNYTALFIVCLVIMIQPKVRIPAIIFYFAAVSFLFAMNEEFIYHYFIHIVRSIWYIGIVEYILKDKFRRKKLVLYEDEKMILDQMCEGKVYQKEVEGFSENTIYRKLKAARERNGNLTRDQLVEAYRNEKEAREQEKSLQKKMEA